MKNPSVPSPRNWPDDPRPQRIKAKKSGLRVIDEGTDTDAMRPLLRSVRGFQRREPGKLVGWVGVFMYRLPNGELRVVNAAGGTTDLADQIMMATKLRGYIES